jgi:hypothetical protein
MLWLLYIIGEFRREKKERKTFRVSFYPYGIFATGKSIYVFDIALFDFLVIFFVI